MIRVLAVAAVVVSSVYALFVLAFPTRRGHGYPGVSILLLRQTPEGWRSSVEFCDRCFALDFADAGLPVKPGPAVQIVLPLQHSRFAGGYGAFVRETRVLQGPQLSYWERSDDGALVSKDIIDFFDDPDPVWLEAYLGTAYRTAAELHLDASPRSGEKEWVVARWSSHAWSIEFQTLIIGAAPLVVSVGFFTIAAVGWRQPSSRSSTTVFRSVS